MTGNKNPTYKIDKGSGASATPSCDIELVQVSLISKLDIDCRIAPPRPSGYWASQSSFNKQTSKTNGVHDAAPEVGCLQRRPVAVLRKVEAVLSVRNTNDAHCWRRGTAAPHDRGVRV